MANAEIILTLEEIYKVNFDPTELTKIRNVGMLIETIAQKRADS